MEEKSLNEIALEGSRRLFFGRAIPIDLPGEVVTDPLELANFDPVATPVQEAEFQSELDKIRKAERDAWK